MLKTRILFYSVIVLLTGANAQAAGAKERPWLESLPIVEQSLELPEPVVPNLEPRCRMPEKLSQAQGGTDGVYSDSNYLEWVELYHKCKFDQLISKLERNLLSGEPHRYAALIWASAKRASGGLKEGWQDSVSGELIAALSLVPEGYRLNIEGSVKARVAYIESSKALGKAQRGYNAVLVKWIENDLGADIVPKRRAAQLLAAPDEFMSWWPTDWSNRDDYEQLTEWIAPGGQLADHFFADAMREFTFESNRTYADQVKVANIWLAKYPNDIGALRFKRDALEGIGRYDEATEVASHELAIAPWFASQGAAESFFRMEQDAKGNSAVSQMALNAGGGAHKEALYAKGRSQAGFGHDARAANDRALAVDPNNLDALRLRSDMERDSSRHALALEYAQKAWAVPDASWGDAARLIYALKKQGLSGQALALFYEAKIRLGGTSPRLASAASAIAKSMGKDDAALEILREARAAFPDSAWMLRDLASFYKDKKQHSLALKVYRNLFQLVVGNDSDFENFYMEAWSLRKTDGIREAYAWAMANSPNKQEAMEAAIRAYDRISGGRERALEIKSEALAKYPDRFWPHYARLGDVSSEADFKTFQSRIMPHFTQYTDGEKEWAVRNLLVNASKGLARGSLSKETLASLEPLFVETQDFMTRTRRFERAVPFYGALGKEEEILKAYHAVAFPAPEDSQPLQLKGKNIGFDRFNTIWRSLQRDRFHSANQLRFYMNAHNKWGGAPVLSHCLAEWAERNYAEAIPRLKFEKQNAIGKYGEDAEHFRKRYANGTSIAGSMRFVGWYHSTKNRALKGSSFVDLDCENGAVTKVGRDGTITVEQRSYTNGKYTLLAEGSSYVAFEYNSFGQLSRTYSNSGRDIRLTYNAERKISKMTTEDGTSLGFEYNEIGKPVIINGGELGRIRVTYDDQGEIVRVASDTPGGNDHRMALRVTQKFQSLLALTKVTAGSRTLAATPAAFQKTIEQAYERDGLTSTSLAIASAIERNYTNRESMQDLTRLIAFSSKRKLTTANAKSFAGFAKSTYDLFKLTSPFGLAGERWKHWQVLIRMAEARGAERPIARFLADVRAAPLTPMIRAEWQDFDELRNPGYWYVDLPSDFIAPSLRSGLEYDVAKVLRNGDMIVGSNVGLLVRKAGVWQRYVYDNNSGGFERVDGANVRSSNLQITDAVELPGGNIAIASNLGIFVLDANLATTVSRIATSNDGLPAMFVRDLYLEGSNLVAATPSGIAKFAINGSGLISSASVLGKQDLAFLTAGPEGQIIVGGKSGVFAINGDQVIQLSKAEAQSGAYSPEDRRLILQHKEQLMTSVWDGSTYSSPVPLTNAASARLGAAGGGITRVLIEDEPTVVALGSEGYAIWQNGFFEHRVLPKANGFPAVTSFDVGTSEAIATASNGSIFRFDTASIQKRPSGPVKTSAYDPVRDRVFFADGKKIFVSSSTQKGQWARISTLGRTRTTIMDIAPDGTLFANDGSEIIRYRPDQTTPEELFSVQAYCPDEYSCDYKITGLLAASDGSIWVTKGGSAFRWSKGQLEEFSVFKDQLAFPANSNWLAGVIELPNGDIVISASDEGHNSYKGRDWEGENLVYRNGRFEKFDNSSLFQSATPTSDRTLIGSTNGFYEFDGNQLVNLATSGDGFYKRLRDEHPNLYLAGEGAEIGENTWLFPTPAGIVGYQNGSWFYPERLNWQYPEPNKADIGGRHTYTLQIDRNGRIYAGTDSGLVIFQPAGGDAVDFLIENDRLDLAFQTAERRKIAKEREIFLRGIKPSNPQFESLTRIIKAKQDLEDVRSGKFAATRSDAIGGLDNSDVDRSRSYADELERKEKEYFSLLAELEGKDPGLAQLLNIKPLELSALQKQIPEGAVVVQYIPQKDKLLLHVISRDKHVVRRTEIAADALMGSAASANAFLEGQVRVLEEALEDGGSIFNAGDSVDLPTDTPRKDLAALYELLIAPIELDIDGFERVYVSSVGALNYVPFAALRRERGNASEYAVQRYNFAMVPTSYLLSLVLQDKTASNKEALIFGDPDGTLYSAQVEAAQVRARLKGKTDAVNAWIGDDAKVGVLASDGPKAKFLHFATHGKLDSEKPELSYLVMADGRRLSTIDVMSLELSEAELAFLSACQTALGREGLEYATLARAFSIAGVPTTIAGLWKVGDQATLKLATLFYDNYDSDAMKALADTQREMIASGGVLSHPAAWSAFQVFGRGWMPR